MIKAHPLTKLQLLLAILWAIPFCVLFSIDQANQAALFFIGIVPFIGLSLITVYLGWLMVFKKENIIYPHESFGIQVINRTRGKEATEKLITGYTKSSRKLLIGSMNIVAGLLSFIGAIVGIVIIIRTL